MSGTTTAVIAGQSSLYNALVPKEGPRSVSIPLNFAASVSYLIDFTLAYAQTTISIVQTVWVDNSANADSVSLAIAATQQTIVVPPYSQGTFPIISPIRPKIVCESAGNVVVNTVWLNVPLPSDVWSVDNPSGSFVFRDGALEVISPVASPVVGAATSIVTGGTAVIVFAANAIINEGLIVNPDSATESLFVDIVNTAGTVAPGASGTTFELKAGDKFVCPPSTKAVTANAVSSGHAFTAVVW